MGNQSAKQHHQIIAGKPKKFVHWKSAEVPSPPGRPILIPVADQEIDVITLKWDRPRTDGGSPIIGYIIEQHRMGSSHWVRATPLLVPITEVAISGLEPGWRYQFRAIAENIVGKSAPSELSDPLTVTLQRNAITVPRFIKELVDTTVIENERVEMKVAVLGQPPPEVNWFKDGFEIFSSRRTKIVNDNETTVLIIHQCAFTDEGEIKCTATNRAGHVATKANLKVVAPPKIRLPRQYEDGLIVEAGELLKLKVSLAGQPPPTVIWSHEGEIINNINRYELVTNDKNSSLKIENVKRSDRGEYTLRASNSLGEDVASFLVTVTSKPNRPGKIQYAMSFGRSVTLSWIAPDDDGGCKIGNYIVEYFRVGWNVWLKAATTRKLSTTLHDLIEGSEYKFRVKAENPYGVSEPSEDSDILFIPDLKRGITEPVREHISETIPPVPPKRRALSPIKNFLGVVKKSSRSPSPNNRGSPSLNVQLIPEIFENETLHREMLYGTPNDVLNLKETKRNVSFKDHTYPNEHIKQKASQKGNKVSEGTQSLSLQKIDRTQSENETISKKNDSSKLTVNQKFQYFLNRTPSPAKRKMSLPTELFKLPVGEENDGNSNPRLHERRDTLILEKVQQFFKRSPTPSRKNTESSENKTASLEETSSEQPQQQQRRDSLIIEKVHNLFRKSPSPSPSPVRKNASDKLNLSPIDIELENQKTLSSVAGTFKNISQATNLNLTEINDNNTELIQNKNTSYSTDVSQSFLISKDKSNKLETSNKNKNESNEMNHPFDQNPTIKISMPGNESQFVSNISRKNETDVSNGFMLVLHPIKKSEEIGKQESFDLELEDALSPTPISLSVPDLPCQNLDLQMPPLRRSVSSTELLYEKAMARFYEAVELEESETRRKTLGEIKGSQSIHRKRLSSIGHEECLSFERRPSLERRLSTDIPLALTNVSNDDKEFKTMYVVENKLRTEKLIKCKDKLEGNIEYDSDYTESTAASSEDSIEKFKTELFVRTRSVCKELETYHPRKMSEDNFSPYRSPTPDQSAIVLNKPLPLPNPDFIPKPILKRSSAENVKDEASSGTHSKANSDDEKPKESGFNFKNIFKKDKIVDTQQRQTESISHQLEDKKKVNNETNKNLELTESSRETRIDTDNVVRNSRLGAAEEVQKKKLELRQSTEEETKVVIEHYSDIVRELGNSRRRGIPLYMRGGDYAKSDEETEKDTEVERRLEEKTEEELIAKSIARPRLSIVERLQSSHVQSRSKSAIEKPILNRENEPEQENAVKEIKEFDKVDNLQQQKTVRKTERVHELKSKSKTSKNNKNPTVVDQKCTTSHGRDQNESKSFTCPEIITQKQDVISTNDSNKKIHQEELRTKTPEELIDEAQETVRSTMGYITDLGLFIVACWVYIFKDVRFVLPILALLVYRQVGEALSNKIPDWMKRK